MRTLATTLGIALAALGAATLLTLAATGHTTPVVTVATAVPLTAAAAWWVGGRRRT